ncbi:hypothetical protein SteCoe_11725 [Stentor coeruleus]|uniref:Dickkopf N-terminal cysteine-rich domain-containing protein n=1 Tax=Stentor coeruleus TaxID=5963 RepID=A0A1R2CCK2_9CILI|nr:hypothetical protein SteCoe_11725 [Stentor coeruleus]
MLLMFLLSFASSLTCKNYYCKLQSEVFYPKQCISQSKSGYSLNPCKNYSKYSVTPFCQPSSWNSTCAAEPAEVTSNVAWPGESCKVDQNCIYGMCIKGFCNAQNLGMNCSVSDQCNPGLYCKSNKCAFQIEANNPGCTSDYDCINGAGCNNGICVNYFSINLSTPLSNCINNENLLCPNITCGMKSDKNYYCGGGVNSNTNACTSSNECVSSVDKILQVTFNSQCACTLGNPAKSLCTLMPSDINYTIYQQNMMNWINSNNVRKCNSVRRFNDQCISQHWDDYEELLFSKYNVLLYPGIVGNDQCTKEIFNTYYWKLYNELNDNVYMQIGQEGSGVWLLIGVWALMI